jgi:hypothetical protein
MSKSCNCQCTCSKPEDIVEGGNLASTEKPKRKRSKKVKVEETLPPVELPTSEVKTKKVRKKKTETPVAPVSPVVEETKPKRKPSAWVLHVQNYRTQHPELSYKQAMSEAKETYNK